MDLERVSVDSLTLDPANVRMHDEANLDAIKRSLTRFGQQKPIVVDAKGVVVAGNGTLRAAMALGWTEIDVVRTNLSGVDAVAYAIADNRTAELAAWDQQALALTLQALADSPEIDLEDAGFSESDLAALLDEITPEVEDASQKVGAIEYRVVVLAKDEQDQISLMQRLESEGYKCQLLMS